MAYAREQDFKYFSQANFEDLFSVITWKTFSSFHSRVVKRNVWAPQFIEPEFFLFFFSLMY